MTGTKRALSQIQGPIETQGDAEMLGEAWLRATEEEPDTLTHGFHAWPARMHPAIARVVLAQTGAKSVVDPFCGGGTTLIEARVAGVKALGVDLNPLAIHLSRAKLLTPNEKERARFVKNVKAAAERSEQRVRGRVPIRVDLPQKELQYWDIHVLKELGGLREEIRAIQPKDDRRAAMMVFSSNLTKVGRQRSETQEGMSTRRIRKGLTTELFLRKALELSARWAALAPLATGPMPELREGDARALLDFAGKRRFELVLTSPPYGGTYDYAAHHARRRSWLELDDSRLRRFEVGSRRRMKRGEALRVWDDEVRAMLEAMMSVLLPNGQVVLVMGDAMVAEQLVAVPRQIARLAREVGLELVGSASQPRPRGREEHILLLRQNRP